MSRFGNNIKISVIMCTYCGEKYIKKQLDSLKNQTLSPTEVKIYDDRSTDNTVEIIKKYIAENAPDSWSIFINKENKGWRLNFYDALKDCDGDIVFFCDQDDIWHLDKIEVMSNALLANPDILLLSSEKYLIDSNDKKIPRYRKLKSYGKYYDFKVRKCLLYENLQVIHWENYLGCTLAAKKKLMQYLPLFQVNEYFSHDGWALNLAAILDGHYHITYPSIDYRIHESNSSISKSGSIITNVKLEKGKWLRFQSNYLTSFFDGVKIIDGKKNVKEVKRLERTIQFMDERIKLFEKTNLPGWISLLKYFDLYIKYLGIDQYFIDLVDTLSLRKLLKKENVIVK
ncbi:MAG: glycosyltransferase [Oscillospiraceae bacterium]|nr:glycosyltransferase [Oscillospiraceae bacterium]